MRSNGWRKCRIGDLLEIKHGFAFKGEFFDKQGDYILLTPGNFQENGGLKLKGEKEKFYTGEIPQDYILSKGDLIVAMTDLVQSAPILGSPAFIPKGDRFLHNQRLGKIVNIRQDQVLPEFLFFMFNKQEVRAQIKGSASGATVRHTSPSRIYDVKVELPSLPAQRRIASILSSYDDLIENNLRRIKILEEMAHALYREWFVKFRFPGHGNCKYAASPLGKIPSDWNARELQELADVIDCLHSKKPKLIEDGPGLFLQLSNIGDGGKLDLGERFFIGPADYKLWTSRIELHEGDCVVTNVGRVGAVAQIPSGVKAAPGRNMTGIRPRPGLLTHTYLIEYLLSDHMVTETARKKDLGTIMDSLNVKGIVRLVVPCPPMTLMVLFEKQARPMRRQMENLVVQNQILHQERNILLHRLLAGQVPVAEVALNV